MKISEIKLPDFLLTNNPMQEYDGLDWIYCPKYLSLVLVISEDAVTVLNEENRTKPRKILNYGSESFEFVIIQNNVLSSGGILAPEITEEEFLNQVVIFYQKYLEFEDQNLDETETSNLN